MIGTCVEGLDQRVCTVGIVGVVASAPCHVVGTGTPAQDIVAIAAIERIVAVFTGQAIIARTAIGPVVPCAKPEKIVVGITGRTIVVIGRNELFEVGDRVAFCPAAVA